MVAVVSGSGLGLFNSSAAGLGNAGVSGNPNLGQAKEQVYVNSTTGNLVIQHQDDFLTAVGLDVGVISTYNSQGKLDDDNGDNWKIGLYRRVYGLTGALNTAGSTVIKVFGDGAEVTYSYNATLAKYVSTDGDGAHDTLTWNGTNSQWTWTDGSARNTETYDWNSTTGKLLNSKDADGNQITYNYTGTLLTSVVDASGQTTYLDYTGNNLTQIRVVSNGQTQTLTRYYYDNLGRLNQVVVDLTPAVNTIPLQDADVDGYYDTVGGQSYVTHYTYDGTSKRVASITQGDGTTVSFTYQSINGDYRVKSYTDGNGHVTTIDYSQPTGGGSSPAQVTATAGSATYSTAGFQPYSISGTLATVDTVNVPHSMLSNVLTTPPGSGATYQQSNYKDLYGPTTTISAKYDNAQTAGDLNVVFIGWNDATSHINSIQDSKGNSYVLAGLRTAPGFATQAVYYAKNIVSAAAGSNSITVVMDAAVSNLELRIGEYGGIDTTNPLDVIVGANGVGLSMDSGALTTTSANDLLIGANYIASGTTQISSTFEQRLYTDFSQIMADRVASAAGSYNVTASQYGTGDAPSDYWIMQLVAFRPSAASAPYYVVPASATWQSIANAVYGVNSAAAGTVLQTALGNPALTTGAHLTGFPATLIVPTSTVVPPYYVVPTGATWQSIANAVYGVNSAAAGTVLQTALGNPALTTGAHLTGFPATLNVPTGGTVPPYYIVQSGNTWDSITQTIYGVTDPRAVTAFKQQVQALNGGALPSLSAGTYIVIPLSFSYTPTPPVTASATNGTYLTNVTVSYPIQNVLTTPPGSGATYQQSNYKDLYGPTTTISAKYDDAQTAGDLNVVFIGWNDSTSHITSVTDSKGNAYIPVGLRTAPGHATQAVYYAKNIVSAAAGSNSITVVMDAAVSNLELRIGEYGGIDTTNPLDVIAGADGVGLTMNSGAVTTTSANDLLIGANYIASGTTQISSTFEQRLYTDFSQIMADRVVSTPGSYNVTASQYGTGDAASDYWIMQLVAFRPAGSGTPYYVVPSGATWQSIANAVYGVNSAAAGTALQTALGNPVLTAGAHLTGFPATLDIPAGATVPPYYIVQSGDTWDSITQKIYGTGDANAVAAFKQQVRTLNGGTLPSLNANVHINIPLGFSYVPSSGLVPAVATSGTYSTIDTVNQPYSLNSAALDSFSTTFSVTENPISEGGVWHHADNGFQKVKTENGVAHAGDVNFSFDDSYALLSGFGPDQEASAVISYTHDNIDQNITRETEILLRFADDANGARGYEVTFSYNGTIDFHRWNGELGDVVSIPITEGNVSIFREFQTGDVVKANIVGNVISAYVNGVLIARGTDSTFATGQPGMGFFVRPGADVTKYTFTSYTARTLGAAATGTYTVPSNATWRSVAYALYGVDSDVAGTTLQTYMGNPPLTANAHITGFPATLNIPTPTTVAPYYTVQSGDTWSSITQAIFATGDANAVDEFKQRVQALNGGVLPALITNAHITIPLTINYAPTPAPTASSTTLYLQANITDPLGQVTSYVHDAQGRLTSEFTPVNGTQLRTDYQYDTDGNITSIAQDPAGLNRVTTFQYDSNGNLLLSRDNAGNTVTRIYNADNQLVTETRYVTPDPDGSGSGQPSTPLTTRYAYDSEDHLRFVISADGRVTEYKYNAAGQRTAQLAYGGATYDISTLSATTTLSESQLVTWVSGQTGSSLSKIERTDYTYDWRGNVSTATSYASTDSAGAGVSTGSSKVQYVYDQRGLLLQKIDALGAANAPNVTTPPSYSTTFTYDGLARVQTTTEWLAISGTAVSPTQYQATLSTRTAINQYDDANNRIITTAANGLITTTVYDHTGAIVSIANGVSGNTSSFGTTTYTYDTDGRLRMTTDPTGIKQFTIYDAGSRVVGTVDGDGTLTEFVYNGANQVVKTIKYADRLLASTLTTLATTNNPSLSSLKSALPTTEGRAKDQITRTVYDAAGRVVYTIDPVGAVTQLFYDGLSRVTDQVQYATTVSIASSVDQVLPSQLAPGGAYAIAPNATNDRHTRNFYDNDGHLVGTLDALGYLVEYAYNAAGHLTKQIGYANQTGSSYWASGTLGQLRPTGDSGRDIASYFYYDNEGRQIGVLDGEGYLTETSYDADGQISQTTRYNRPLTYNADLTLVKNGVLSSDQRMTTAYVYDGGGRVIAKTESQGTGSSSVSVQTQYIYDAAGHLISMTRAAGSSDARTTQTQYDELGRITKELSAEGTAQLQAGMATATAWDRYGISYTYDQAGRRTSATSKPVDPNTGVQQTNTTFYYYNEDGQLRFTVNALGERTENRYNALGQLTDTLQYANRVSTAGLSGGLLTSALITTLTSSADSTKDAKTTFTYKLTGQLDTSLTVEGAQVSHTYNAFGEETGRTEKLNAAQDSDTVHKYTYDQRGLLIKTEWDPTGINRYETYLYDAFGRRKQTTDQYSNVTKTEYDRLGRAITTYDARNSSIVTSYDAFDRTLSITDRNGNLTTFTYNDASRTVQVSTIKGTVTRTQNVLGETIQVKDESNSITTTSYNKDGQVVDVTLAAGVTGVESTTHYAYDTAGRTVTVTEGYNTTDATGSRTTQYVYDGAGRRIKEIVKNAKVNNVVTDLLTEYRYDGKGNLSRKIVGSGILNYSTWYVYDKDNRLTQTIDALGGVTENTYDNAGNVIATRRYAAAISTSIFGDVVNAVSISIDNVNDRYEQFVYDNLGRQIYEIQDVVINGANRAIVTKMEYDANGNVIKKTAYAGDIARAPYSTVANVAVSGSSSDRSQWTVYDENNRAVLSVDATGAVTQNTYDANGNIVQVAIFNTKINVALLSGAIRLSNNGATAIRVWTSASAYSDIALSSNSGDRITRYWYDGMNRQRFTLDAEGYLTQTQYSDAARQQTTTIYTTKPTVTGSASTPPTIITSAGDQTTTTLYDAAGRISRVTDATQVNYEEYTYDAVGNKIAYRNQKGAVWNYQYDANRRLIKEIAPPVDVFSVTGGDGALTVGYYDPLAPQQRIETIIKYDALGNVTSRTEAANIVGQARTTSYGYDALGRQVTTTYQSVGVYNAGADSATTAGPSVARVETSTQLSSTVYYDTLGNAWKSTDVNGQDSFKLYDALGRVTYEIDAKHYVTLHQYDVFGNEITLTRYSSAYTSTLPTSGSATISVAPDVSNDRTITKTYDLLNRLASVEQPATYVWEPTSGASYGGIANSLGARTEYQYNAYGQVILERRRLTGSTWADTYRYYDHMGRKTAEVDPLLFLTTYQYDETGDLTQQIEYSKPLTGSVTTTAYSGLTSTTPSANPNDPAGYDRITAYGYDILNRLVSESLSNFEYSEFASNAVGAALNTVSNGISSTTYAYDAVGNRTAVTVNNASTYTYYDALGHIRATAEPTRNPGDDTSLTPLTEMKVDAFGMVLERTQYSKGTASANATAYASPLTSSADRTARMVYDSFGRVTHIQDPTGAHQYKSYTKSGDVAKEWQPVTNNSGTTEALVSIYTYDELGRQTRTVQPQSLDGTPVVVTKEAQYNAFGEVTAKRTVDATHGGASYPNAWQETFEYDRSGHVWRTNTEDGTSKVYLYNLAGQASAEFRNQAGNATDVLAPLTLANISNVFSTAGLMRTETVRDKDGRITEQRDVSFTIASTVGAAPTSFSLSSSNGHPYLIWSTILGATTSPLQYRVAGSNTWTLVSSPSFQDSAYTGYDLSGLASNNYEFRVTFTRLGESTFYALHTGTFSISSSVATALSITPSSAVGAISGLNPYTVSGNNVSFAWVDVGTTATLEMRQGPGAWQSFAPTSSSGYWFATATGITDGTWEYRVTEYSNGMIRTLTTGSITKSPGSTTTTVSAPTATTPWEYINPAVSSSYTSVTNTLSTVTWAAGDPSTTQDTFAYRLLGSTTWIPATITGNTSQQRVSFNSLPPGTYEFTLSRTVYGDIYVDGIGWLNHVPLWTDTDSGQLSATSNSLTVVTQSPTGVTPPTVSANFGAVTTYTDYVSWAASSNSSYVDELLYAPHGVTQWAYQPTLSRSDGIYSTNLGNVADGLYDFWILRFIPGGTTVTLSGMFSVAGGIGVFTPNAGTPAYLSGVSSSGTNLTWAQAPHSGDTVSVSVSGPWSGSLTPTVNGANFAVNLNNLPSGTYTYTISYTQNGTGWVYSQATGTITVTTNTTPASAVVTSATTPGAISGFQQVSGNILGWTTAAAAGSSVLFRYKASGATSWAGTLSTNIWGSGYSVDLSSLSGSIDYEVTYTAAGASTPYAVANGTTTINRTTSVTGSNLADTTSSAAELAPQFVLPRLFQVLDRWGNVTSYTDAASQTTKYRYNQRGQVVEVTQPTVAVRSTLNGTIASVVNAAPVSRNYYDKNGLLIATVDPDGNRNRMTYNAAGQVTSQTIADATSATGTVSGTTQLVYDAFGEQIQITDALGFRTRMGYDGAGREIQLAREAGTSPGAFGDNDPTHYTFASNFTNVVSNIFTYDQAGRRKSETSGEYMADNVSLETTKYWYDLLGHVVKRQTPMGFATTDSYDVYGNGKKTQEIDAIGGTQTWSYDYFGHLTSHTDISGDMGGSADPAVTTTYAYNQAGMLKLETSTAGKNIAYSYDEAGHLITINDTGVNRLTSYTYDTVGRRAREQITLNGVLQQDTSTTYDALGRIQHVSDARYQSTYEYDAAGNRTHVTSNYFDASGTAKTDDIWYRYDGANRVLVSQGANVGGTVAINNSQGIELTYDAAGQRKSARQWGNVVQVGHFDLGNGNGLSDWYKSSMDFNTAGYSYDGLGRLIAKTELLYEFDPIIWGSPHAVTTETRQYDRASRQTYQFTAFVAITDHTWDAGSSRTYDTAYDDNGRILQQITKLDGKRESSIQYGSASYTAPYTVSTIVDGFGFSYALNFTTPESWSSGFDAAGNLRAYTITAYDASVMSQNPPILYTSSYNIDYRSRDSYQETAQRVNSSGGPSAPFAGSTSRTYNADNELVQFTDNVDQNKNRYFANNASGVAVNIITGNYGGAAPFASALGSMNLGYAYSSYKLQSQFMVNDEQVGSIQGNGSTFKASFDANYTPISSSYPASAPAEVVAQLGDTLKSLARRVWGDENLWYLLAEENGLTDPDTTLTTGRTIRVPNDVISLRNTASVFKPYDVSAAIGDTTPTQPPPPPLPGESMGCGGRIIMAIIVAIVSWVFTPTVGNIVGQGLNMLFDQQDKFNWKSLAVAAATEGISQYFGLADIGAAVEESTGSALVGGITQGLVSGALTQGVSMLVGLQDKFSWRELAISAAASGATRAVGKLTNGWGSGGKESIFARNVVLGATSVGVRLALGGKVDTVQVTVDIFGNALANSLVDASTPSAEQPYRQLAEDIDAESQQSLDAWAQQGLDELANHVPTLSMNPDTDFTPGMVGGDAIRAGESAPADGGSSLRRTDISGVLKDHAGRLSLSFGDEGVVTSGLGDSVDQLINGSPTLQRQLKEFMGTKIDGNIGRINLTEDTTVHTDFEQRNNAININIGEHGIHDAEAFVDALAHEIGHYKYDNSSMASAAEDEFKTNFVSRENNGTLIGYDEYKKQMVDQAIRQGRLTEAAAVVNEFRVFDEINKSTGIDLSGLRSSGSYKDYRNMYDAWARDGSSGKSYAKLLSGIGAKYGHVEHPNDPSSNTGSSTKTYEKTWRQSGQTQAAAQWRASGYYATWDNAAQTAQRNLDKVKVAQMQETPQSAQWKQYDLMLKDYNEQLRQALSKRGPR